MSELDLKPIVSIVGEGLAGCVVTIAWAVLFWPYGSLVGVLVAFRIARTIRRFYHEPALRRDGVR